MSQEEWKGKLSTRLLDLEKHNDMAENLYLCLEKYEKKEE